MKIDKTEFEILLNGINICYANEILGDLPKMNDFPIEIFQENYIDLEWLLEKANQLPDGLIKSVSYRIIAIYELRNCRDSRQKVDLSYVWKLIYDSILVIPNNYIISSIGSQGFLSIPLFKFEKPIEEFDFIRLHIWDNTLKEYINTEACENFSIHTHSFYAESWILCGKVINDQFIIEHVVHPTNNSLFNVAYNKSLNEINQHTSSAKKTHTYINYKQVSHEMYMQGGAYSVKAGDFHKSGSEGMDGLSATFFSFTARNGLAEHSYVIGPSDADRSEINRKMHIDPTDLLKRINKQVGSND